MNTTLEIADAVVTALNGESFSQEFTALRKVMPSYRITDLASLKVTVVPSAVEMKQFARAMWMDDHKVEIGVQKRLTDDLDTSIEAMSDLVNEIVLFLRTAVLTGLTNIVIAGVKVDPIYSVDHLKEDKVFFSVIHLTYKG